MSKKLTTLKYIRYEGERLIIVPTKDGVELLRKLKLGEEGVDVIGGAKVTAFITELDSPVKFFRHEVHTTKNEHDVYVFTEKGAKLNARFAITVDEPKKEETKKQEPVKTEVKQEEKKAE
jgi:hypothetical protein